MITLPKLKAAAQAALRQVSREKDIRAAEVFASSTGQSLCRLNYTSAIPCHGVEEPKSTESYGLGVRAVFEIDRETRVGFGSEARDLSPAGIRRAIEKARLNAVPDPEFSGFPEPMSNGKGPAGKTSRDQADRTMMDLKDETLVTSGWRVLQEALKTFDRPEALSALGVAKDRLAALGLIVGGDVTVHRQRMAIASTTMPKVQTDESTYLTCSVTSMIERKAAKGTGYDATAHFSKFKGEAGSEAVQQAIKAADGVRLPTGTYAVVLGPQPVADIMTNVVLPSLSADAFYASRSAFLGDIDRPIAANLLSVYDHGAAKGAVGTKRLTCEGLPTGRTDLIRRGTLCGLLSSHYETQRLLRDPQAREKLGLNPVEHPDVLVPRNGFRLSSQGSRQFDAPPTIAATNVFIEGAQPHTTDSLLNLVGDGVYIGRIWYTYPMNGLRAGDFTCTIVGDSYEIKNGRLGAPLRGNAVRLTANIRLLLRNVLGITQAHRPIVGWASDEVIYAPEVAVRDVALAEIAQFADSV